MSVTDICILEVSRRVEDLRVGDLIKVNQPGASIGAHNYGQVAEVVLVSAQTLTVSVVWQSGSRLTFAPHPDDLVTVGVLAQ